MDIPITNIHIRHFAALADLNWEIISCSTQIKFPIDLSNQPKIERENLMATLATTVDGLKLPNPFVIGSGPPGTNLNVISRAFKEGWGAVIAKTVSLDASKVVNV